MNNFLFVGAVPTNNFFQLKKPLKRIFRKICVIGGREWKIYGKSQVGVPFLGLQIEKFGGSSSGRFE